MHEYKTKLTMQILNSAVMYVMLFYWSKPSTIFLVE
jgi:hypothetical protein